MSEHGLSIPTLADAERVVAELRTRRRFLDRLKTLSTDPGWAAVDLKLPTTAVIESALEALDASLRLPLALRRTLRKYAAGAPTDTD